MDCRKIFFCAFILGICAVNGESGLDEEDKKVLLQAHNYYRSLAAEHSSNMERMIWNEQLEKLAEQHVKKCHVESNDNVLDDDLGFTSVGENQAVSTSLSMDYHLLVGKWYEEGRNYRADTNSCMDEEDCYRYLQLVWATTTNVGCAIKKCKHAVPSVTILVCHYGPGMTIGISPFKLGSPCSACPSEHHVCKRNLCSTEIQNFDTNLPKKMFIPHFIMISPSQETMFCYEVKAKKGLAYNLLHNEHVDVTGYFTYYQNDQESAIVLLDTVSVKIISEDSKLPKRIVISGSKQDLKIDDVVLSLKNSQSVTIMETEIVAIPTKMDPYSEVLVKMESIGLQFAVLLTNDSQLQFIFLQTYGMSNKESNDGLIGQFCHEDATTDEEKGLLYLKGFDPIKIVQRTLTNQPKATMDKLCQFIAQPMIEDIESRYVLIGT